MIKNKVEIEEIKSIEKQPEKRTILLNISKEVLLNSTSHGLPNILRNESIAIKTVWLIFLLTSTALCSYLCIQSILAYYKYDVTTKTRRIYESPTLFPTIGICTKQTYSTDFGLEFLKKVIPKYNYDDIFNESIYENYKYDMSSLSFYTSNLFSSANIDLLDKNITDDQKKLFQQGLIERKIAYTRPVLKKFQ